MDIAKLSDNGGFCFVRSKFGDGVDGYFFGYGFSFFVSVLTKGRSSYKIFISFKKRRSVSITHPMAFFQCKNRAASLLPGLAGFSSFSITFLCRLNDLFKYKIVFVDASHSCFSQMIRPQGAAARSAFSTSAYATFSCSLPLLKTNLKLSSS